MAKKSKPSKKVRAKNIVWAERKRNPNDATMRNVRAVDGRLDALEDRLRALETRVDIIAANRPPDAAPF